MIHPNVFILYYYFFHVLLLLFVGSVESDCLGPREL